MGSNLGNVNLNFLFAKFIFDMNLKGQKNPSRLIESNKAEKRSAKQPLNDHYTLFNGKFRFSH